MTAATLAAAVMIVATGSALAECQAGETVIRFVHQPSPQDPARTRAANGLKAAVDGALQGRACLRIDTGEAFADRSVLAALAEGKGDLSAPTAETVTLAAPVYGVFALPFAFRDLLTAERFAILARQPLTEALSGYRLRPLGHWTGTMRQLAGRRAALTPQALAGARVAWEVKGNRRALARRLRITFPRTEAADPMEAVAAGALDLAETTWRQLAVPPRAAATAEAAGAATETATTDDVETVETNHRYRGYVLLASQAFLDGLKPADRDVLLRVVARTTRQANAETRRRALAAARVVMRRDAPVWTITDAQRRLWRDAFSQSWSDYRRGAPGTILDLLSDANRAP